MAGFGLACPAIVLAEKDNMPIEDFLLMIFLDEIERRRGTAAARRADHAGDIHADRGLADLGEADQRTRRPLHRRGRNHLELDIVHRHAFTGPA